MSKINPILISLVLLDSGGIGHNYEYLNAVGDAAQKIGWQHYAALPSNCNTLDLRKNWSACIVGCRSLHSGKENILIKVLRLIWTSLKLAISIRQYLKKTLVTIDESLPTIIFVDTFKPPELLAFVISLFFIPSNRLKIWLLYRHDDYQKYCIGKFYQAMNWLIQLKFLGNHFIVLTDSDKLANSLSFYFKRQILIMPIPHTQALENPINIKTRNRKDDLKVCAWWCGNPNPEKGLANIQRLVKLSHPLAQYLHLFISEDAHIIDANKNIHITYLPAYLTRQEYLQKLIEMDVLLLPYEVKFYRERTSGIFVEAICSGKIPLVTQETWMASELIKYNLVELILDWTEVNIIESILSLSRNTSIQQKVFQMREQYLKIHSVDSYADHMQKIYKL
jgi:hypothetical protein